jgi:integrase
MAIHKLASLEVARLPDGRHSDGGGLYLQVRGAARSWIFKYQLHGRLHFMGLGSANAISLKRARELAAEARTAKAEGIDPLQERREARTAAVVAGAKLMTFRQAADEFLRDNADAWRSPKNLILWRQTLGQYVYPHVGHLPVQDIDTPLVLRCIKPLWSDKTETASRIRARIERILDWAGAHGYRRGDNPARWKGCVAEALPRPNKLAKTEHHAALPYTEISAFVSDLRRRDSTSAHGLEFLILTAARTGEVIGAQWSEIDLVGKIWTVPARRMKGGKEHRVPLSDRAIEILRFMQSRCQSDYIFPGQRNAGLSNMSLLAMLKVMQRADLTVHGFRSTFRDWSAEQTNFPREVCEMALAHAIESKVEAAYRRGDLFEKRRRLMQAWSEYCARPGQAAGTVVNMRGA